MMSPVMAYSQEASTAGADSGASVAPANSTVNVTPDSSSSAQALTASSGGDSAAAPMPATNGSDGADQQAASPAGAQNKPNDANYVLTGNFFQRLAQFYKQDWAGTNPSTPLPPKRGLPAPLDSGPFPSADWTYGGAPDIGAPDGNTYPLMSALGLSNSRTTVYGWVATSINFSTSGQNNFPVTYDIF